jgi:hypothetical protein
MRRGPARASTVLSSRSAITNALGASEFTYDPLSTRASLWTSETASKKRYLDVVCEHACGDCARVQRLRRIAAYRVLRVVCMHESDLTQPCEFEGHRRVLDRTRLNKHR